MTYEPPPATEPPPPGYGAQPGYGGYPPPSATPYSGAPSAESPFGIAGVVLAVLGAVLGVLAFTVLNWFDSGSEHSHFSDVRDVLRLLHSVGADHTTAYLYFKWLAWVLLAVAVVSAIVANAATPLATTFRFFGALVGLAGIVVTFVAIDLVGAVPAGTDTTGSPNGYWEYLKHSRVAFYFAIAAFLMTTVASLVAPRRSSS